jgi:hypothetical protein
MDKHLENQIKSVDTLFKGVKYVSVIWLTLSIIIISL